MKKFVYIYHLDNPQMTPSEGAGNAWMQWFESMGDKIVDGGNPFNTAAESQAQVKDQNVTMNTLSATGYTVVKATDLKEAVEMAMKSPMATGDDSWIEVFEALPM
jgi:hypothetical protein